jgi:hypothetical protein
VYKGWKCHFLICYLKHGLYRPIRCVELCRARSMFSMLWTFETIYGHPIYGHSHIGHSICRLSHIWAFYMPAVPYMGQIQIKATTIKPASFESAKFSYSKYTIFFEKKPRLHIAGPKGLNLLFKMLNLLFKIIKQYNSTKNNNCKWF